MRVFLMRWFKWTVEQFEKLNNPKNCEVRVMELGEGEEYSLLVHHTQEELEEWGLDVDMIKDQEQRKHGKRGDMNGLEPGDEWPRSGFQFFENHEETSFLNRELEQCEAEQMATDEENYFLVDGSVRGG